jgi:hypothetical protein
MLMYPLEEAVLLLSEKLSTAKKNLNNIKDDLEFLREQVTVMEVNFARVHNVSSTEPPVISVAISDLLRPPAPFVCVVRFSGMLSGMSRSVVVS